MDTSFYIGMFKDRLHWFLLCVAVFTAAGVGLAVKLPATYRAAAVLVVESEKIPDELAASTVETAAVETLEIIDQRIRSREAMLDLATRMRVYGTATDTLAADAIVRDMRDRITYDIDGSGRDGVRATLLTVAFDDPLPARAAAVANELVTLVLAEDVRMRTTVARQTLEFFEQEVARLDQDLSRMNARILTFREENRDALPEGATFLRARLDEAEANLALLEDRAEAVRRQRERQQRLHDSLRTIDDTASRPAQTREERILSGLRRQRDALPSGDPQRAEFEDRIESLSRRVNSERLASGRGGAFARTMADYDAELDEIAAQTARLTQEVEAARVALAATPGNALTLATLERDYDLLRSQYTQAVEAKSLAETGDAIETLSKGQRISVIEQAVIPGAPFKPNRVLIAGGGLFAGVSLGLILVGGLIFMQRGLRRPDDLVTALGITPFGVLPYIYTEAELESQRRQLRMGIGAAVLSVPVALAAVHMLVIPLDLLVALALRKLESLPALIGLRTD
ncbi:lipopolysaccharide biosynthesis protein [Jannaschia sp. Os4]|uniref:GumC family protein n=1 Tax=Jannaschia sp. Os4 TaxID=2807617 RepID=UPI00193A05BC|nr:lipopolysaccharide biosynthesis protein [Jannaschia sp. Os4]MBM2575142.1 lipopolysaccharide biosynthesis protein [Jannaschia sp. Os4]